MFTETSLFLWEFGFGVTLQCMWRLSVPSGREANVWITLSRIGLLLPVELCTSYEPLESHFAELKQGSRSFRRHGVILEIRA